MASPAPRLSLLPPMPGGTAYAELLSRTRDLRSEQRAARDRWYAELTLDTKEDVLFELEVLLKATACFANPRNHAGPQRRTPVVAQDFRESTVLFREAVRRAMDLVRLLLGARDRAFVFHRYLETVLPEDSLRTRLVREGATQTSPEESLIALRHALANTIEVTEGLLRAQRVPYRLFYAVLSLLQREIAHNTFFNPLTALEFRPEFDRIQSPEVLELMRQVPEGESHRLVALTFLSLFRMLRYVDLLDRMAKDPDRRHRASGRIHLVLSVLRSDARALSDYLHRRAGTHLADSWERSLFSVPAREIRGRADALRAEGHRVIAIRSALECVAANVRLEMRRAFLHDLSSPDSGLTEREVRGRALGALENLRPGLRNAVLFFGRALGVTLEERGVFDDAAGRRETAERLRRDVWMFAQIVRGFYTKAQATQPDDLWTSVHGFEYVREFLAYFRTMGYPLLRAADSTRFDAFTGAMAKLRDTDLVDPARLEHAVDECMAFHGYLQQLFGDICKRDVLEGVPFDRRAAAQSLKLYLGDMA